MVSVSIDHTLWYVDAVGFVLLREFPVGVAEYLMWETTSNARRLTSSHHLWSLPVVIYQLKYLTGSKGVLTWEGLFWSYFVTFLNVCLSRAILPSTIPNGQAKASAVYLNVNLSREVWKDVQKFEFLRIPHDSEVEPFMYLVGLTWRWCCFNTVIFFLMKVATGEFGLKL